MTGPTHPPGPARRRRATAARRLVAIAAGGAALVPATVAASPAAAHGAPDAPVSRAVACSPGGEHERSPACRAAVDAGGGRTFEDWDNLRVSGVAGRDRQVIPDGRLCSGGLEAFRGLDVARPDWPTTALTAGSTFDFTYRSTIPHRGTFRLYVTREGYDPARPLRWADLEERPFLEVTDPPLTSDSYAFRGRLPRGRVGRHLIYTVWQNSDTPDTYYSCSDVVLREPSPASGGTTSAGSGDSSRAAAAGDTAGSPSPEDPAATTPTAAWRPRTAFTATVAGVLLLAALTAVGIRRRLRRRRD